MTNSLLKILITGANGQLGHALAQHAPIRDVQVIACTKKDLDITSSHSITTALDKYLPNIVINTAAYTAVDKAESESATVMLTNHFGTEKLAVACAERRLPIIHISTDYIFDGKSKTPYKEEDKANPINLYGQSKWLGEQAVRKHCDQHIILRISGVFSEHGKNFFNTMIQLEKNGNDIRVTNDQLTCPTFASDIADAIFILAKKHNHWGTYHFCSSTPTSWHHFAETVLQRKVSTITAADYPTAAKRPTYSVLDCKKIELDYGIKQPSWEVALRKLQ